MNDRAMDEFYGQLFTQDPEYSRPYPNPSEAMRWGPVALYLSSIACARPVGSTLRILDVGCGRGWLTYLANIYGRCDGIDPVEAPLALARRRYPGLLFMQGTLRDVYHSATFQPYDAVIVSEVIEHVIDKDEFVTDLARCVVENGHIVLTTPRLEMRRWLPFEPGQPVEAWLSERDLRALFLRHGLSPIQHDHIDVDLWSRHPLDRLCKSRCGSRWMDRIRLAWMKKGFEYVTGVYQVWWFQKADLTPVQQPECQSEHRQDRVNCGSITGPRCATPTDTGSSLS